MALLAVQPIGAALNPVNLAAASAGGDTVPRTDNGFVVVRNGDSGPHTVTIDTPGTTHGLAIADEGVTVAAGATAYIAVSDSIFEHPSDHLIHLTYDGVTSVTVALVSL